MKRVLLALDGAFVLGLGFYMLLLSQTEAYAAFMNPKFRPLTAAAAVGFCIVGAAFLIRSDARTDVLRTLCFAILGVLALHAGSGSLKGSAGFAVKPPAQVRSDPDPHLVRNGDSFLKSNPARLFLLLQTGQAAPSDQRYVTRGIVKRSAQLDRLGKFALLRGNMVCCLADAIAMGMMVSAEGLPALRDGDWLVVFGRVRPFPEASPITDLGGTGEVSFSMVYDKAFLVAEAVEKMERPRFPYVFELPQSGKGPLRLTGGEDDY
jgi:hypothetical protein